MNKTFLASALKKLRGTSNEELQASLNAAGIEAIRKNPKEERHGKLRTYQSHNGSRVLRANANRNRLESEWLDIGRSDRRLVHSSQHQSQSRYSRLFVNRKLEEDSLH
jgi:hypothetical protein